MAKLFNLLKKPSNDNALAGTIIERRDTRTEHR